MKLENTTAPTSEEAKAAITHKDYSTEALTGLAPHWDREYRCPVCDEVCKQLGSSYRKERGCYRIVCGQCNLSALASASAGVFTSWRAYLPETKALYAAMVVDSKTYTCATCGSEHQATVSMLDRNRGYALQVCPDRGGAWNCIRIEPKHKPEPTVSANSLNSNYPDGLDLDAWGLF